MPSGFFACVLLKLSSTTLEASDTHGLQWNNFIDIWIVVIMVERVKIIPRKKEIISEDDISGLPLQLR